MVTEQFECDSESCRSRIVPGTERGAEDADPRLREDYRKHRISSCNSKLREDEAATLRGPHEFEKGADDKAQLAKEKFVHVGLFAAPGRGLTWANGRDAAIRGNKAL